MIWLRDGVRVHVDGERYEMIQSGIERQSYSRYRNTLLIRDAADLAGDHTYTCSITNNAGSTSESINTRLTGNMILTYFNISLHYFMLFGWCMLMHSVICISSLPSDKSFCTCKSYILRTIQNDMQCKSEPQSCLTIDSVYGGGMGQG